MVDGGVGSAINANPDKLFAETAFHCVGIGDVEGVGIGEAPLALNATGGKFLKFPAELPVASCHQYVHRLVLFVVERSYGVGLVQMLLHIVKLVRHAGP